jgi:glycosyltransferase involved in cell wall biosynthesis
MTSFGDNVPIVNVGLVIGSFGRGGTEKYCLSLANELVINGYQVAIYILSNNDFDPVKFSQFDARVKLYVNSELSNNFFKQLLWFRKRLALDHEIIIGLLNRGNLALPVARFKSSTKIIATRRRAFGFKGKFILHSFLRFFVELSSDLVIYNSKSLKPKGFFSRTSKYKYIPNFVELPSSAAFKATGIQESKYILTISNLRPEKGLIILSQACEILNSAGHHIRFKIAGDGPLREEIERKISDGNLSIELLGKVDDTSEYLERCLFYVHPSITEGFSNSILEAMSFGKMVISTNVGAAADCLGSGDYLVEPNNPFALAHSISNYLKTPIKQIEVIGENNRRRVLDHFSKQSAVKAHLELFEQLI